MDWYRLRVVDIKDNIIFRLMSSFERYQDIFKLSEEQLKIYFKLDEITISLLQKSKNIDIEKEIKFLEKNRVKVISLKDKDYPVGLKNISHPPVFLYYRGDINLAKENTIGVVGTRQATSYGRELVKKLLRTCKFKSSYCKWISFRNRYNLS